MRVKTSYYAVLKDHSILEAKNDAKLTEALEKYRPNQVVFVCRGARLKANFEQRPAVSLTVMDNNQGEVN